MTADGGWVWMYGVAGGDLEARSDGVTGIGGAPPRTIAAAGLTAIVGDVGDREYGEAALRRNLEDLDWLARTARAHHAVLESVAERGPVVPMRLATLFASDAGVTGLVQERADAGKVQPSPAGSVAPTRVDRPRAGTRSKAATSSCRS